MTHLLSRAATLFLCGLTLAACTATYAPQTNAPARPLLNDEVELEAGFSGLAELSGNNDLSYRSGVSGTARLGVSDHLMIGISGWMDELSTSPYSGGAALEGLYTFHSPESRYRLGAHLRYAQLYAGNEVLGHGTQWGPVLWLPKLWKIAPVVATEGGYFERFSNTSSNGDVDVEYGFLWTQSLGFGVELPWNLQVTGEMTSTFYFLSHPNLAGYSNWWTLAPSISVGWRTEF